MHGYHFLFIYSTFFICRKYKLLWSWWKSGLVALFTFVLYMLAFSPENYQRFSFHSLCHWGENGNGALVWNSIKVCLSVVQCFSGYWWSSPPLFLLSQSSVILNRNQNVLRRWVQAQNLPTYRLCVSTWASELVFLVRIGANAATELLLKHGSQFWQS